MCFKPNREEGREKLERWQKERGQERQRPDDVSSRTAPRGNQDPDRHDLERSLERLETLVGN